MSSSPSVLVVGGYGVVGTQICEMLSERHPQMVVMVGGRALDKAQAVAGRIKGAVAVRVDLNDTDPLAGLAQLPDAVVVAVTDSHDRLLMAATRRGIAIVDITRWSKRIEDAQALLAETRLRAPVVIASGWMAGAVGIVAAAYRDPAAAARQIDLDMLFSLADKAGPDSVSGFVDMNLPFLVWEAQRQREVKGFSDAKTVHFSEGRKATTFRYNSPDQMTLVQTGHAQGMSSRMAFDSGFTTWLMAILARSGLWGRLSRDLRKKLLYNPGAGAAHEFIVTIRDGKGERRVLVKDPLGQTHLTSAAVVTQVARVLGLNGRLKPEDRVSFPEESQDLQADIESLRMAGVEVRVMDGAL